MAYSNVYKILNAVAKLVGQDAIGQPKWSYDYSNIYDDTFTMVLGDFSILVYSDDPTWENSCEVNITNSAEFQTITLYFNNNYTVKNIIVSGEPIPAKYFVELIRHIRQNESFSWMFEVFYSKSDSENVQQGLKKLFSPGGILGKFDESAVIYQAVSIANITPMINFTHEGVSICLDV